MDEKIVLPCAITKKMAVQKDSHFFCITIVLLLLNFHIESNGTINVGAYASNFYQSKFIGMGLKTYHFTNC